MGRVRVGVLGGVGCNDDQRALRGGGLVANEEKCKFTHRFRFRGCADRGSTFRGDDRSLEPPPEVILLSKLGPLSVIMAVLSVLRRFPRRELTYESEES